MVELRDVAMTPLAAGNSKTRMAMAADPPSALLGHHRYGRTESVVKIQPLVRAETDFQIVDEPIIYGGLLFRHFGHAISESIHRLWPRFAVPELAGAKFAFFPINHTKVMPYVIEALNLHGISGRQVLRVEQPTLFRRLFVGPQARQMAGPTIIPGYQQMLDGSLDRRAGPAGGGRRIYVSRMHHHHTGSFYGESFIEAALEEEGFEIIYPERFSLTELIKILRSSSIAVFAEGSAIHALELCGSAVPAVFVIGRRSDSISRFTPLLSNICRKWTVSDRLLLNAGMSTDRKKHSGLIDLVAVFEDLQSFAELTTPGNIRASALAAIRTDLERHIGDPRNDTNADDRAGSLRRVVETAISTLSH
ncbi:glycosyltransferase 61 family protein [Sphingomonas daechungensis]